MLLKKGRTAFCRRFPSFTNRRTILQPNQTAILKYNGGLNNECKFNGYDENVLTFEAGTNLKTAGVPVK